MIRKNLKLFTILTIMFLLIANLCSCLFGTVQAVTTTTYISLSDTEILVDGENISEDSSDNIYLTNSMDNGGTSSDAIKANIEIENVINIAKAGTYEFSGDLSNGQISINSNDINGDITIILNNVNIICENAPAIFVYNATTNSSTCNVTIKLAEDSINTISGGKIKQSVEGWSDQSEILYYIDKGYDDDQNYYERYKYDAAISSDISLTFEGEGTLTVNALKKEGIETKRDITINSGNYIINALDDGINACTDNESVITINGGTILVNVQSEAEEGDGIDSNGYIYINDGTIYAFACENSQDNGLDSDSGTYINGGTVVATGNMADAVSDESTQTFLQLQFNSKVEKGDLITITDSNENALVAFKSDRAYSILTVSTSNLVDENYNVYEGGTVEGTSENGLYTAIDSYEKGTEKEYSTTSDMKGKGGFGNDFRNGINKNSSKYNIYVISIMIAILVVILIISVIALKKEIQKDKKTGTLVLFVGILIGAIIVTIVFFVCDKLTVKNNIEDFNFDGQNSQMMENIDSTENTDNKEMPSDFKGKGNGNGKGTKDTNKQDNTIDNKKTTSNSI
jgi:hypothetical protein